MEDKYFIPSIEDIRIGWEGEVCPNLGYDDNWEPIIGKCEEIPGKGVKDCNLDVLTYDCLVDGYIGIRVPYLTQEQIEKEGWEYKTTNKIRCWYEIESPEDGGNWYGYYIYKAQLIHDPEMNYVKISFCFDCIEWETVFEGECKCINTLRSVMKLLRMKIKE